jgi:flagellar capping protein FliD
MCLSTFSTKHFNGVAFFFTPDREKIVQIINNANSTFSLLNSTRSASSNFDVRIARDTINRSVDPRETRRNILFDSTFVNIRKVPSLESTGPLAAFRVADAITFLSSQAQARKVPIVNDLEKKERFSQLKLRHLDELSTSLKSLRTTVASLLSNDRLNPKTASSTRSQSVQAEVKGSAPLNSFHVTPVRLSQMARLSSDQQPSPPEAMGLTGSFSINGNKIKVEATDSLFELKNKINFGEDQNRNGVLDKAEDLNNNGTLDIIRTKNSEFVSAIFIIEDLDADGVIDPDEDVNKNGKLDGGIDESKVLALIQDNRLILKSMAGGRTPIDLLDSDEVLLGLGFFKLNSKGFPVQKDLQFDEDAPGVNLIHQPQTAKIKLNGKLIPSDSDVFSEAIEDTKLIIKKTSENTVKIDVSIDFETFFSQIKILVGQFNNSISKINNLLEVSRIFKQDEDIQDIRNDLTIQPQKRVRKLEQRNESIDAFRGRLGNPFATGITVTNTEKNSLQEVAVTAAAQSAKNGITRAFQSDGLLRRLGSIGIRSLEDNTFELDKKELHRGLNSNTKETFDLFTNSETGILPTIAEVLDTILRDELGDLAIEETEVSLQSQSSEVLAKNFRKFKESVNFASKIQTLITVA